MTDLAVAESPSEWRLRAWSTLFIELLLAERSRWILWVPVGLGLGDILYFSLLHEPSWLIGASALLLSGAGVIWARGRPLQASWLIPLLLSVATVAGGFTLAQWETWRVAAPVLDHRIGIVPLSGRITDIEEDEDGGRITIAPQRIERVVALPRLVRIRLRRLPPDLDIGDEIALKAGLMPPPGPFLPGGFDFQRQSWFKQIGAVGFGVGTPVVTAGERSTLSAWLRSLRRSMAARIRAELPGASGAIAASLVTGERGAIPPGVTGDYRDSGLAHLLVIAGLHMTLVTGFVFFATRAVLALIPAVALRYPIKQWSAAAAMVVALLYLAVSGAAVPTQRAFIMVSLVLGAILVDRAPVSMRSVAIAATVLLVLDPSCVTGVSFQMSFAAVVALISFYEAFGRQLFAHDMGTGRVRRIVDHVAGIALTSIVTTVATGAYSIYHFNRFALFSVLANVIAVPIAGFWVMPLAFVTCLLMPLGLDGVALVPLGWGLDRISAVAHWTANLNDAVLAVPTMPVWGLGAISVGGLWLALWQKRWRLLGLLPVIGGVASILFADPPDLLISDDGNLVAVRTDAGYILSSERAERADAEAWMRATAGHTAGAFPAPGSEQSGVRCDADGCLWSTPDGVIAFEHGPAGVDEDCTQVRLLIAETPVPFWCRRRTEALDPAALRHRGAVAAWLSPSLRVEGANDERGDRPWVVGTGPPPKTQVSRDESRYPTNTAGSDPPDGPEP